MINNRMLAVAAVLVMAVPALGAATPIVVPPVPEQLVEGHTVFTVIEIVAQTATNESRFAAAVAVLVREYQAEQRNQRFPGVLWFNDQYLVNPVQNTNRFEAFRYPCGGAVMAVNRGDPDPRVVIARVTTHAGVEVYEPPVNQSIHARPGATVGDDTHTYNRPPWVKPYPGTYTYNNDYAWIGADVDAGTFNYTTGYTPGPTPEAWSDTVVGTIGGSATGGLLNGTFGILEQAPWDYRESYLITDPNDHSWIIDKYEFYTRDGTAGSQNLGNTLTKFGAPDKIDLDGDGIAEYQPSEHWPAGGAPPGGELETQYRYPVWVVNILGSPVFVPDYGTNGLRVGRDYIGENCTPFKDLIEDVTAGANGVACGLALQDAEGLDDGNDTDVTLNLYNGVPPWTDNPCMSYEEPSRNGYCYGGQSAAEGCYHGPTGNCNYNRNYRGTGPEAEGCFGGPEYVNTPLRQYNALLYFKLDDLYVWDGVTIKDHCNDADGIDTNGDGIMECDPANSPDTNGCSQEQYSWGPNPPLAAYDWPCPGGNDNAEGNSHPFHPVPPPNETVENCLGAFRSAPGVAPGGRNDNPTNHGGSSYVTPSNRATDDGWYRGIWTPCDYAHTTRDIDIYFSPAGRPFPPPVRHFDVIDLEGSSAPFHDFHNAYPGVSP